MQISVQLQGSTWNGSSSMLGCRSQGPVPSPGSSPGVAVPPQALASGAGTRLAGRQQLSMVTLVCLGACLHTLSFYNPQAFFSS